MRRRFMMLIGLVAVLTVWGAGAASAATPWVIQATPNPSGALTPQFNDVSCATATNCTAVGDYYTNDYENLQALAEHWNGSTWSIQATLSPSGSPDASLVGVSCTSATSCTTVGGYTVSALDNDELTLAEHWNGKTWSIQATPNPSNGASDQLEGISCISATTCTAAGWYASSLGGANPPTFTLAEHS